jgi:hypothetical protein
MTTYQCRILEANRTLLVLDGAGPALAKEYGVRNAYAGGRALRRGLASVRASIRRVIKRAQRAEAAS